MLRQPHRVRPRLAALALVVVSIAAVPAAVGAGGPSQREQQLRRRDAALAAESRSAVLGLYALESQLARARASLTSLQGRTHTVERQRADVAVRLKAARRDVATSQRRLAARLRALYEQSNVDPIAVVLGAQSLDAAMTGLDGLSAMVRGQRSVLSEVERARTTLVALEVRLGERQERLARLLGQAKSTERTLQGARDSRAAYVSRLASERRLARTQIARLERQARAAVARSRTLQPHPVAEPATPTQPAAVAARIPAPAATTAPETTAPATAPPATAPATTAPAETSAATVAPQSGGQTMTVTATGYAMPGDTATGLPVGWGVAAVDPSVIPLGTKFTVPGYGEAVAADVGSAIRGDEIDLWFPSVGQARRWGRRIVTITLHS